MNHQNPVSLSRYGLYVLHNSKQPMNPCVHTQKVCDEEISKESPYENNNNNNNLDCVFNINIVKLNQKSNKVLNDKRLRVDLLF